MTTTEETVAACPACGSPIDYCQGHGPSGDPAGHAILVRHDDGDHADCHPDGCDDAAQLALVDEAVDALDEDGARFVLPDGRALRLIVSPDESQPFDEVDMYGRVVVDDTASDRGYPVRPDGFDGNAEKLSDGRDTYWWQPPNDVRRGTPEFTALRRLVLALLVEGWYVVSVELLDVEVDAYRRPIVREVASLGGVEPGNDEYRSEIVRDLINEVL